MGVPDLWSTAAAESRRTGEVLLMSHPFSITTSERPYTGDFLSLTAKAINFCLALAHAEYTAGDTDAADFEPLASGALGSAESPKIKFTLSRGKPKACAAT